MVNYEIINGTSKKGKSYQALKVEIGEYRALLFPTKIEMMYIKSLLKKQAHEDFQNDGELIDDNSED